MTQDAAVAERLVFHLDNVLHARVHTLLIVQALLFVGATSIPAIRYGVALFAVALTLMVALANINIARKLRWAMSRWAEADSSGFVRDYLALRSLPLRSLTIYTWLIPLLLCGAWSWIAYAYRDL